MTDVTPGVGTNSKIASLLVGVAAFVIASEPSMVLRGAAPLCVAAIVLRAKYIRLKLADWLAIGFAGMYVASSQWTIAPERTAEAINNQILALVVFLAIRTVVSNKQSILLVSYGFLSGCVYVVWLQSNQSGTFQLGGTFSQSVERLGLAEINANYLAYTLCTGLAVAVVIWKMASPGLMRSLVLPTTLVMLLGIVQAGTRGAAISIAVLALWLAVARKTPRTPFRVLVTMAIVVGGMIASGWADKFIRSRLTQSDRETGDLNGRLTVWPIAREAIGQHPIFGNGGGAFRALNSAHIGAHNAVLEVASGLGLVGLALFLGLLCAALFRGPGGRLNPSNVYLVGAFIAVSAPILLSGYWDQSTVLWLGIALFSRLDALSIRADQGPSDGRLGSR